MAKERPVALKNQRQIEGLSFVMPVPAVPRRMVPIPALPINARDASSCPSTDGSNTASRQAWQVKTVKTRPSTTAREIRTTPGLVVAATSSSRMQSQICMLSSHVSLAFVNILFSGKRT
jgi:hypothetical protein